MNVYHTALSLPKNVFKENISVNSFPLTRRIVLSPPLHLSIDIIRLMNNVGLRIGLAELFYSPPYMVSGIHKDTPSPDISKINWVYKGYESEMAWYATDSNKKSEGSGNNTYIPYSIEESKLLHKSKIHSPSIIQAAIAHHSINKNYPRWAVSLMLFYKEKHLQCKYNDAITRLSDYIS